MRFPELILLTLWLALFGGQLLAAHGIRGQAARPSPKAKKPVNTLVVYVYAETDAESRRNLLFFVQHGVRSNDGAHYIITIQTEDVSVASYIEDMQVPQNVRFLRHFNICYDWGTFGWVVRSKVLTAGYKFFIMLNSSVRGPFLPPYLGRVTWHKLLTERLNSDVLMVGPTVSCEGTPNRLNMTEKRQNPHVQSYVLALNRAGFRTLLEDGNVLQCWSDRLDAIYHAELGASAAILRAGYNVDCLLQRYQGYDWRDRRHWACNNNRSPVGEGLFGGSTLSLHDLMFVKVKTSLLADGDSTAMLAVKYSSWKSFDKNISSNIWYDARLEGRA